MEINFNVDIPDKGDKNRGCYIKYVDEFLKSDKENISFKFKNSYDATKCSSAIRSNKRLGHLLKVTSRKYEVIVARRSDSNEC